MGHFIHNNDRNLTSSSAGHPPVRKAATFSYTTSSSMSSPLDAKSHKHYHSHDNRLQHTQPLEHSTTSSSTGSMDSSSNHQIRRHRLSNIVSAMPNPIRTTSNSIEDHVAEFRYQHNARAAKREAHRLSQHEQSGHRWGSRADSPRLGSSTLCNTDYEEVVEDWKDRDEQAWQEELRKRELARRRTATKLDEC